MNADFIEQWKRDAAAIKEYARVHQTLTVNYPPTLARG